MVLKFQNALFGVGGLLALIGIAVGFMAAGQLEQVGDLASALSAGVTSSFFALFSGVLIGIGTALVAAGFLTFAKSRTARAGAAALLCLASFFVAFFFLGKPSSFGFAALLSFLAAAVFTIAMLVIAGLFYFTRQ